MKTKSNLFIGACLLFSFIASAQNTFLGTDAGTATSTNGVSIGYRTLYSCTTCPARLTTGNSVLGYLAGTALAANSNYNVLIGFYAGYSAVGSNNTYLGTRAGALITGSNNVMIGNYVGAATASMDNKLLIDNNATTTPTIFGDFTTKKIGIGGFSSFPTTSGGINISGFRLFVKGGILTEEVRVSPSASWADYVFTPEYKLPSLAEVEQHIKKNGHLINVPSAKEIKADGIALGQMATIQQEKIEELTLYVIEQNKINEKQREEIDLLKEQVQLLLQSKKQ